jgi:hypothetical protein
MRVSPDFRVLISGRHFEVRCDMESLVLLAFGEEEFLTSLAMESLEAFFNQLLIPPQAG